MSAIGLLVTGVVGAVAALALSTIFGYSSSAGYHLPDGNLTSKETALLLKFGKIAAAAGIATAIGGTVLSTGPLGIVLAIIGGVVLLLYAEIDNWRFP